MINLEEKTLAELKELAKENNIKNISKFHESGYFFAKILIDKLYKMYHNILMILIITFLVL